MGVRAGNGLCRQVGCSRGVQYAVTAFFALDPIWGAFIQTQVKDTLYTGLFCSCRKPPDLLLFPQKWQGNRPRLTAYAVLGVLCCLLRKNGIYAVVPMLLVSACTVSEKRLRRPVLAVLLAVCIGSFGFDMFTEKVLHPRRQRGGGTLGPDAADRPLYPRLRQ